MQTLGLMVNSYRCNKMIERQQEVIPNNFTRICDLAVNMVCSVQ